MGSAQLQFEGFYLDKAQVLLDPDPQARPPSQLETGDHWIVWLSSFQKGGGPVSGRGRQTTIFLEFASMPPLNQPVDLATVPLQVSYEYGGEALLYISREATGTMTLSAGQGNTYLADIDATFINPILGSGSQLFQDEMTLQKHPHPDFSTP
ncbi:MAG: hypothetical protein BroJett015_15850 [Chloroflexota bacterium]|nr:MAG: hypothetical protein BroJett015_15850 [Chloroflexota bacterium]